MKSLSFKEHLLLSECVNNTVDMISEKMEPFTKKQLKELGDKYNELQTINPSSDTYKKLKKFINILPVENLKQLRDSKIKFLNVMANTVLMKQGITEGKKESLTPEEILKNVKKFRMDSDVGYLLTDDDIIMALTNTGMSFDDAEKYFKDNYKKIKV